MSAGSRSERALAAAMAHHRAGRLTDAERLYRGVCEAEPDNARAFHLLGVVAHQLRRPDAASLIGRAVVLDPGFAEAHNDRGVILAANGLISDALACFESAVALVPGYTEARNNLGRGLRSLGRFDAAVAQFELVLKSTPNSALAHFNLASVLEPAGQQSAAEKHYRSAIAMRPDFVDAHLHLASLLEKMDRLPEALAYAESAVALRPDVPARATISATCCAAGAAMTRRSHNTIARSRSIRASSSPTTIAAWRCAGEATSRRRRARFERAVALKPDFLEAEFAACMAELPVLYDDAVEHRRAPRRLCAHLARLSAEVARAGTPRRARRGGRFAPAVLSRLPGPGRS